MLEAVNGLAVTDRERKGIRRSKAAKLLRLEGRIG
jgi:hypothetical protein